MSEYRYGKGVIAVHNVKDVGTGAAFVSFSVTVGCLLAKNKH